MPPGTKEACSLSNQELDFGIDTGMPEQTGLQGITKTAANKNTVGRKKTKTASKKSATKTTSTKKSTRGKTTGRKTARRKTTGKKTAGRKSTGRKTAGRRSTGRKTAKRTTAGAVKRKTTRKTKKARK